MLGFATQDTSKLTWSGFEVDLCRGVSAVLFNGASNVMFRPITKTSQWFELAEGRVDILASRTTHTLEREMKEPYTGDGFDFTSAYYYDGLGFSGPLQYGFFADHLIFDNVTFTMDCTDTKKCILNGTTWLGAIQGLLNVPEGNIVVVESTAKAW